jgi:hypothetical protein
MAVLSNWSMLTEKYSQLADELIEIVNATPLRIEYNRTVANPTSTPFGLSEDNIGNPNYIENMYNRIDQQGVVENVGNFQEVTCRAYWNAKDLNFPLEFKNDPDICKIITYTTDNSKLQNCSFVYVNGVKCKIVQEPIPYGFGKRYSESYARKVKEVGE